MLVLLVVFFLSGKRFTLNALHYLQWKIVSLISRFTFPLLLQSLATFSTLISWFQMIYGTFVFTEFTSLCTCNYFRPLYYKLYIQMATSKTWTRTLDPDTGTWTRTMDPDPKKPGPWKTWETAGYGKMIRRPHIITY